MEVDTGEKIAPCDMAWANGYLSETFDARKEYSVSINVPMATPVDGGIRPLNVALHQALDLYQSVRPVRAAIRYAIDNQRKLLIRPFDVLTRCVLDHRVLEIGTNTLRRLIQHQHMFVSGLAQLCLGSHRSALAHGLLEIRI